MLKVHMTGLLYFNGCAAPVKHALAPDGRGWPIPHQASLFVDAALVNPATTWWSDYRLARDFTVPIEGQGNVDAHVIEFRIPYPATISFPDGNDALNCHDLDTTLAKLYVETPDSKSQKFVVGEHPQTIAEVTFHGGFVSAGRYAEIGLIEWRIDHPPALEITATLKQGGDSRTIVLNGGDAEVVFANIHEVFDDANKDLHGASPGDSHVPLYRSLNPSVAGNIVSLREKPAAQIKTANAVINRFKHIAVICGDIPPCCG